jgi:UDP-N-acetyl-D-glucosamine dehydrogenase
VGQTAELTSLAERISARTATVGIVGLGYVGLPMLVAAARSGYAVLGFDRDDRKVDTLRTGRSYVEDVPDPVLISTGATFVMSPQPGSCDVWVIAVPTPLRDGHADLQYVLSAARTVGGAMKAGDLVCLESTTYPGTTREEVLPLLLEESGLEPGQFSLAYSPERIDPGSGIDVAQIPKLVAGLDETSTELARQFYESLVDTVVVLSGLEEAELAKLLENTFRQVNIALVNQLATVAPALGVDFWEAMRGASTKPFGFMPFRPGPGVGGHCIPIDAAYLAERAKLKSGRPLTVIEAANDVNQRQPSYVGTRVADLLNSVHRSVNGARVLGIGIAYKPGVADVRESPAVQVLKWLEQRGALIEYHDPLVPTQNGWESVELWPALVRADVAVVLTDQIQVDWTVVCNVAARGLPVLDTRGVLPVGRGIVRL